MMSDILLFRTLLLNCMFQSQTLDPYTFTAISNSVMLHALYWYTVVNDFTMIHIIYLFIV